MKWIVALLADLGRDQRGATAIEYAFIAGLVTVATIATIAQIGLNVGELTSRVMTGLN
ncbi:MAG TPA: Flp family type IVb pilin [Bosea sp. (in: a-proteobacteria)]|jgi:pilus assembly protein Flp/PilA|uniref:Flp family type IVb pilin n=1 Tax=Bosea sp. (in: a-proteobacteria) TaxID=1871050 RepID=UPI002DDCBCB9|nr:Flp family type IVb pilin [Bosea sp. (in: a-proteobacteria)]HEV2553945.1 Flp family type IVb pilin [Bosea sp. (in: a-proteobacteria)]